MEFTGTYLILFSFVFLGARCDDDEPVYALKFKDKICECEDFENKVVDCSGMGLEPSKGDDGDEAKLCGQISTNDQIECGHDLNIDIYKINDMGNEIMWNMRMPFGKCLDDKDGPCYSGMLALNITECPVSSSIFTVEDITINLGSFQDVLCHDFCGDYIIELSFIDLNTKVSCHTLLVGIIEIEG